MDTQPKSSHEGGGSGSGHQVAVDQIDKPGKRHMLPVWFFIGAILLIYGILIFVTGILEYSNPADTVLANLHAPIWWGAILTAVGAIFFFKFYPRK